MASQPLDRGRVCFIAEKYETGQQDGHGHPERKARYAQVGRATLWPAQQGNSDPEIMIELDSAPIAGGIGPVRLYIFWDSRDPNRNGTNNWGEPSPAPHNNQQPYQNHPQNNQQSQGRGPQGTGYRGQRS